MFITTVEEEEEVESGIEMLMDTMILD